MSGEANSDSATSAQTETGNREFHPQ